MDKFIKVMPSGLVFALSLKAVILGCSFSDVAFLAVLSSLSAYFHFATGKKDLQKLQTHVENVEKTVQQKAKELDEVKTHLSGIKLASTMRPVQSKF